MSIMKNYLKYYFNCTESLVYEIYEAVNQKISSQIVTIQISMIYQKMAYFNYNTETDALLIESFTDNMKYLYPDFSKLSDESYHFQKMTVWPHIGFESTDVQQFMNEINRIREEHETKFTTNP